MKKHEIFPKCAPQPPSPYEKFLDWRLVICASVSKVYRGRMGGGGHLPRIDMTPMVLQGNNVQ